MRVTLLGTGCPVVDPLRFGPSALVESGGERWLVDCGNGVTPRLLAHGTNGAQITGLLLTHLHSDHTVDIIQLLISGWHQGRTKPLKVYGPKRTARFIADLMAAWRPEFEQRKAHELRDPAGLEVIVEEIDGHWRLETPALTLSNTEVRHQPIPQAFGFRFDAQPGADQSGSAQPTAAATTGMRGACAVISGDTAYCPELIELARDCDLLVHEAFVHWQYAIARKDASEDAKRNIASYHTPIDQVGKVAAEAGAGHLALTHFVPIAFDRERLVEEVRRDYSGGLSIGEDGMSFAVAPGAVTLARGGLASHR